MARDGEKPTGTAAGLLLHVGKRHFYALDLSRLIAAGAVLFWHYQHFFVPPVQWVFHVKRSAVSPWYPALAWAYDYGHLAVEYFWLVSGFVFAHVYLADAEAWGRFWPARVARLWPLHLLTLVLVAGLQGIYIHLHGIDFIYHTTTWYHFWLSLPLAQFWGWQVDQSFNGPSWSLSTEILAYAVFWVALPLLRRVPPAVAGLLAGAVATTALVPAFRHWPDELVFTCIGYFFAGTAVYAALAKGWLRGPIAPGLALIGVALAWHWAGQRHGLNWAILAGSLGAMLAVISLDLADHAERWRAGRMFGDAAYGVYLWHFPLQLVLVLVWGSTSGVARQPWFLLLFLALSLAAGFASTRWFERPAQRWVLGLWSRLHRRT